MTSWRIIRHIAPDKTLYDDDGYPMGRVKGLSQQVWEGKSLSRAQYQLHLTQEKVPQKSLPPGTFYTIDAIHPHQRITSGRQSLLEPIVGSWADAEDDDDLGWY